ncbi:MAG: hypothetical protein Q8N53_00965 [Longimicrobiales bacterium]|nr:hypothetical protein [Longimicrobiales bacterium]
MTLVEIAELRDFITGELQKVHTGLAEVRTGLGEVRTGLAEVRGEVAEVRTGLAEVRETQRDAQEEQIRFQDLVARHHAETWARLSQVVTVEAMRRDFQAFGEALSATDRRLDEFRVEVGLEFKHLRADIRAGFDEWGGRVRALEGLVTKPQG